MNTEQVDANKKYTPLQIARMGLILNSKNNPSHHFVLNEIKAGNLPMHFVGKEKVKFYVYGWEILEYLKKTQGR